MKKLFATIAALGLLQACGGNEATENTAVPAATGAAPAVTVADVAPAVPAADATASKFQTLDGQPLELSAYAGKKVFVNYWATWCAPCIREIPSINRAAAELEDENYVFLLASDEKLETISDFLLDRGFSGNFIKLNGYFGAHGIDAVPSSVLYDESGVQIAGWAGSYEWDSPEMLAQLRGEVPELGIQGTPPAQ